MVKKFILVALIAIALVCLVEARPRKHIRRQLLPAALEESDSEGCGVECYSNLSYCQDNNRIRHVCGSTNASRACWDREKGRCASELQQCKARLRCPQWISDNVEEEEESDISAVCANLCNTFYKKHGQEIVNKCLVIQCTGTRDEADDEESDFFGFLAPIAFNLIKNKLSKRDEAVEEADAEFLGKALKKVGKVALGVGKMYLRTQGIPLDDEEADTEFFKNLLKKVGGIALQAGKAYVGSKYGIQLDEEEEADFINWKKIGEVAKNVGKSYLSSKYGINLDEQEESDAEFLGKINWGKIGGIAKDIGKTYLSSKYGINLDEEEADLFNIRIADEADEDESDAEFKSVPYDDAEEESDAEFWGFVGRVAWNVMKPTPAY